MENEADAGMNLIANEVAMEDALLAPRWQHPAGAGGAGDFYPARLMKRYRLGKIEKVSISRPVPSACREIDRFPWLEYNQPAAWDTWWSGRHDKRICRFVGEGFSRPSGKTQRELEFAGMATQELTVSGGSFDTKERVKQAVDIVDLVGSHIQLRRQGRNYVGLCPWHDDTRPASRSTPSGSRSSAGSATSAAMSSAS